MRLLGGVIGCVFFLSVAEMILGDHSATEGSIAALLVAGALTAFLTLRKLKRSLDASVASGEDLRLRLGREQAVVRLGELTLTDASWEELVEEACRITADELDVEKVEVLAPPDSVGTNGCIAASIGSNGSTYGVLTAHANGRRTFTDGDAAFVRAVANLLASVRRRQNAEAQAETNLRVLEAVIEGTSDDVFVKDREGRFIVVNGAAARTLGLPREQLVGRTMHEVMPASAADEMARTDRLTIERGVTDVFEEKIVIGDQPRVFLSAKGPYRAHDGTLLGTFGIARDITERTRQEQALARSEERMRLAQEGARMGTWDRDLATGETTWSDGLRTIFGVDHETPAGFASVSPLIHPDDQQWVTEKIAAAYERGADLDLEYRLVRPDGAPRWMLIRSTTLRDAEGAPARLLGIAIDITEQKQAEEDALASRDYANHLIETSNALVLVLDPDANVVAFNHAAEEITGYSREEVVGRNWDILLPRDRYADVWAAFGELVDDGLHDRYENPILTKSGEERQILWQNSRLHDRDGTCSGTVSFGIDITETVAAKEHSRMLEAQLRQAEKLEAIGQLAGGVAHDFNNLLVVIRGYAESVKRRLESFECARTHDADEILAAADRAAELTRQLLAFARRQVLSPEAVDLNEVVESTSTLLRRMIGERVELVTRLVSRPVVVHADRGQLEQVIVNLAINARDAMPAGGAVTLEVAADADAALLRLSDEGTGIDAEVMPHIFEPFFTTKGEAGTGLGLATVHGIVAQSGGQITVGDNAGGGSTFTVSLPLASEGLVAEREPQTEMTAGGDETILVLEDDAAVRAVISEMLETYGFRVISASDGEHALTEFRLAREPIPLVLSDVIMPGLDGPQTLERIRETAPQTKALLMSGYARDGNIRGGKLPPGTAFIQKPFSGDELVSRIRALLDGAIA
ncbi:MAG: hybrid sensor histidine kinase/response regulator [Gaiellaceae bacterium]